MKTVLVITSVASMVDQFLLPTFELFQNMGYEVHVACNFERGNTCSDEKVSALKSRLRDRNILYYQIGFARDVTKVSENICAYKEVNKLVSDHQYDLIHCHSPIGGLITRIVCRKMRKHGTSVIYTAHGFHFFKGAPIKNWMLYYPVEKICSRWTDVLITINREDYALAKKRLNAARVEYLPGVGIDVRKFAQTEIDLAAKRAELGVPEDAFLLLSVGELNHNKNHATVIRALAQLGDRNVHYAIAGKGELKDELLALAEQFGVNDRLHLLGYRDDVHELYRAADVYIHPSLREGLPVSVLEAMASGLGIIASSIRGNEDLVEPEKGGILCAHQSIGEYCQAILRLMADPVCCAAMGAYNRDAVVRYDVHEINRRMLEIYEEK